MNHSTGKPTKYEAERIDAMRKLGCVACAQLGVPNLNELELHHLLDGGVRMGHWFTIFLCRGHHQGQWNADQKDWIPPDFRVSIAHGRKAFMRVYPSERILWTKVQQKLRLNETWPPTKLVARRAHVKTARNSTADDLGSFLRSEPSVPPILPRGTGAAARDSEEAQ